MFVDSPSGAPPLLTRHAVYPLIFHSIQEEIPEASRPLITRLYQLWLVLLLALIINMVANIFILTAGGGGSGLGSSIGYVRLNSRLVTLLNYGSTAT